MVARAQSGVADFVRPGKEGLLGRDLDDAGHVGGHGWPPTGSCASRSPAHNRETEPVTVLVAGRAGGLRELLRAGPDQGSAAEHHVALTIEHDLVALAPEVGDPPLLVLGRAEREVGGREIGDDPRSQPGRVVQQQDRGA